MAKLPANKLSTTDIELNKALHPPKVYGIGEAEEWFLENHDANGVLCVHASGETKLCKTYPEAVDFFTS